MGILRYLCKWKFYDESSILDLRSPITKRKKNLKPIVFSRTRTRKSHGSHHRNWPHRHVCHWNWRCRHRRCLGYRQIKKNQIFKITELRRLKKTRSRNSWEGSLWREKHRWQRILRKPGSRLRKKKNGKTARKKWRSTQILSTQIVKNGHRQGPKRRHRPLPRCRIAVSFTSVTLAACSLLICWSVDPLIFLK